MKNLLNKVTRSLDFASQKSPNIDFSNVFMISLLDFQQITDNLSNKPITAAVELPVQCTRHSLRFHISSTSFQKIESGFQTISVAELTMYDNFDSDPTKTRASINDSKYPIRFSESIF